MSESGTQAELAVVEVKEREWSCSQHSFPWAHSCECSECECVWDCEECATSKWSDEQESLR